MLCVAVAVHVQYAVHGGFVPKVYLLLVVKNRSTYIVPAPPMPFQARSLTVLSRAVVVSGGAIHTPAILLRSGLRHPLIGRHLHLHPVLLVGGVFPEDYRDVRKEDGDGGGPTPRCPAGGTLAARTVEPRSPDFGRGVMMGVFVQDWMGLDGGKWSLGGGGSGDFFCIFVFLGVLCYFLVFFVLFVICVFYVFASFFVCLVVFWVFFRF